MKHAARKWPFVLGITLISMFTLAPTSARGGPSGQEPAASPLRLQDLEAMALRHNPTLAQAAARVRAARGRTLQAGLYPNPSVGYTADEVSTGPVIRGGEHGFFIAQDIVTAGKLRLRRSVSTQEERQLEAEAERQKLRVLTAVRVIYYRAVTAERLVELRGRLAQLAREAVTISGLLYNVGQADEPDVLEGEVEAERAELALLAAQNERERVWRHLAAVVGVPSLRQAPLQDKLDDATPELEFESLLTTLLKESPEIKVAQAGVARAEQAVKRERAEWVPNIVARGGLRYNRELLERGGRPVGLEGFADVGVQIPIFDRNQGNVKTARADLERARLEIERVKLSVRARLAAAYREYRDALVLVRKYRDRILPRAQRAYDLYLSSYQRMAAAYPQVLIAQRTYFQLQADYIAALGRLWLAVTEIRGFLVVNGLEASSTVGESRRTVLGPAAIARGR